MKALKAVRRWFYLGDANTPAGSALLIEQFRILTTQIPILYGVLIINSLTISYVLPPSLPSWFRFGVTGGLLLASVSRINYWVKLRGITPTAEQALAHLLKTRIMASALNAGFSLWALALFDCVDLHTRGPVALLVSMASAASAYCLGSFPSAARLTLLISALPMALRLMFTGDAMLVCIGLDLCLLLVPLIRMMNTNYSDLVNLVASRAELLAEGWRARTAEMVALNQRAKAREIADRFDTALNNMSQGLCFFDGAQRLIVCNRRYIDMYDLPPDTVKPGMLLSEIVDLRFKAGSFPAMTPDEYLEWRDGLVVSEEVHDTVVELMNGRVFQICHRPMPDGAWVATHEDITERYRAEKALTEAKSNAERAEAAARLLFEENPLPMWVVDVNTLELLAVNAATCRHYGYSREQMLAMTVRDLRVPEETEILHNEFRQHRGMQTAEDTRRHITADGRVIDVAIEARPLRYNGRDACVAVAFDMTDRKRAEQRILHLARHDALTDLPNRAALDNEFSRVLDDARQHSGSFAVLCIDLDRFKQINDLFGHSMGDKVLREAARRLQLAAQGAFLARIGGDEFIAITQQDPLPSSAELLANRLRGVVAEGIEIDGHCFDLDLSLGIAVYPRDGEDARSLFANADAALYRAKHDGRGAVRFFTPAMDQQLRDRRALEHELRSAVANSELFLEYQPQRHGNGEIIGFEALVRWRHPQRGIVSPTEFIPVAEESDLIVGIGEWVLREACREAASWDNRLQVAVNVSAIQFHRGDLQHLVRTAIHESKIPPARLELEITEGVLIENVARTTSVLNALKKLGVRIALDDFGTGYSSLSYLQSFPLDRIKIDRSFIASLGRTDRSLAIVRAVIGLAHGLGLPVLAEGVETNDQLRTLIREGCDEMQGHLIGRPRPIEVYADITSAGSIDSVGREERPDCAAGGQRVLEA
jgi:diguanylate cyclase (GGDEF)-like protein/PAS domain S-box-containing protein